MTQKEPTAQAAERLGLPAEFTAMHDGRHQCVDGRGYEYSCLITDRECHAVARYYMGTLAPACRSCGAASGQRCDDECGLRPGVANRAAATDVGHEVITADASDIQIVKVYGNRWQGVSNGVGLAQLRWSGERMVAELADGIQLGTLYRSDGRRTAAGETAYTWRAYMPGALGSEVARRVTQEQAVSALLAEHAARREADALAGRRTPITVSTATA